MTAHLEEISEQNKALRHFSRHTSRCSHPAADAHKCNYPKKRPALEKLDLSGVKGWDSPVSPVVFNNHHLIPTSCLKKFETWNAYHDYIQTIRNIYYYTDWCASREGNLIRIPANQNARASGANGTAIPLPAHNCDHWSKYGYNDQVTIDLHAKIWMKAKKVQGNKQLCKEKKFQADILSALEKIEEARREGLVACGKEGASMVGTDAKIGSRSELLDRLKSKQKEALDKLPKNDREKMVTIETEAQLWGGPKK